MAKTPIHYKTVTPAAIAALASTDLDKVHNYILVNDDKGNLHHLESHNAKYITGGTLASPAAALTMLRNDATD